MQASYESLSIERFPKQCLLADSWLVRIETPSNQREFLNKQTLAEDDTGKLISQKTREELRAGVLSFERGVGLHFKGLLIDFGGTLAYLDELENKRYEEALVSALEKYGRKRLLKEVDDALAGTYVSSTRGELKTPQEFWGQVLRKLEVSAEQDLVSELEAVRRRYISSIWKLYDGVCAALAVLRKEYRLALVSNCAVGTDELIESLGLDDFFSCKILSYQVGVRKPDKRMYLEALSCLKLEAHECVFVADEISDLEGAREIGLGTMLVWQGLDTLQGARNANFKPEFEISRISEITRLL